MHKPLALAALVLAPLLALAQSVPPDPSYDWWGKAGYDAPGASEQAVSVSTVSTQVAVAPGGAYALYCDSAVAWRLGATTATAVYATDHVIPGPAERVIHVPASANVIAFIMASGSGSCRLSRIWPTP